MCETPLAPPSLAAGRVGPGITEQRKDFERHDSVLRRDRAFLEMHMMEWILQECADQDPLAFRRNEATGKFPSYSPSTSSLEHSSEL